MKENYKVFDVDGRKVKMLEADQHNIFNHSEILPKKGSFYFKIRVIKTSYKYIFMGICGKNIISAINAYNSPYFMGFYLYGGNLYGNGKYPVVATNFTVVEGQSVFKAEIDMDKKWISWFINDILLYSTEIPKQIVSIDFCPMFTLYTKGDAVEILNK